jgi:hypothetical protein
MMPDVVPICLWRRLGPPNEASRIRNGPAAGTARPGFTAVISTAES